MMFGFALKMWFAEKKGTRNFWFCDKIYQLKASKIKERKKKENVNFMGEKILIVKYNI